MSRRWTINIDASEKAGDAARTIFQNARANPKGGAALRPARETAESLDLAVLTRKEKQTRLRENLMTWGELT